ncbi:hypothetical protein HOY80DRAFT_1133074 [Tuber brumale]|nr:hypothetical protein HOY80DRAFT_1133074 [Tuber brumale]
MQGVSSPTKIDLVIARIADPVEVGSVTVSPGFLRSLRQTSRETDNPNYIDTFYFTCRGEWYSVAIDELMEFEDKEKIGFEHLGEEFDGATAKSKKMRVAQLHVACPARSAATRFILTLDRDVQWDEERLRGAMIDRFHDAEREDQADEDILTTMSTLQQGNRDVFRYTCKVLKLLQWKLSGPRHYDRILIGYYLDGLTRQRLRELSVMSFRTHESQETPVQVIKGVMWLATQLRIKGYRNHDSGQGDEDDKDADGSDRDVDTNYAGASSSDEDNDDDDDC